MNNVHFTCASLAGTPKQGVLRPDKDGYYDMVIGGLNILNSAGEYYDYNGAKSLFENSSSFMRRVRRGALRGEVGHPRREVGQSIDQFMSRILDIDEKNTCVHFADIYLDFENFKNPDGSRIVAIMSKLRPSGAKGDFLQRAIDNPKENVCFSIRSFTDNSFIKGRVNKVIKTIVTFDYVNEPGIHIAEKYKAPALESQLDLVVSQGQMERAFDQRKILSLGQESALMSKEELFASFGWVDTDKASYLRW